MNSAIFSSLEPVEVWKYFGLINAIPRGSRKEEKVIDFLVGFAEMHGLRYLKSWTGNVIIEKAATIGMNNKPGVVLQSHVDMVQQKDDNVDFDFLTQGIEMFVHQGFVRAKGTTLGADNGIGVASMLAVLASENIAHPKLEALFTVNEEAGMTGARELKKGVLKGKYLFNLDSEDDRELTIGCAGGLDLFGGLRFVEVENQRDKNIFEIVVTKLTGGHSGVDIHHGRGNAIKIMIDLLTSIPRGINFDIVMLKGGSLRNVIPRSAAVKILMKEQDELKFSIWMHGFCEDLKNIYKDTDPEMEVSYKKLNEHVNFVLEEDGKAKLLGILNALPNGIYTMSSKIPGLVRTSCNLAIANYQDGQLDVVKLLRSTQDAEKVLLANSIKSILANHSANIKMDSEYPAWTPNYDSKLVEFTSKIYRATYNRKPKISVVHGGLECGLIRKKYPKIDMVSIGPNIYDAHTPNEKVDIKSVNNFWKFLLNLLKHID